MKKLLSLFILMLLPILASADDNDVQIVALSPQDSNTKSDYLPFVEIGKQWHVVSNPTNPYVPCSYERYEMYDEEKLNGKTYVRTGLFYDESVVEGFHEIGLFREENRRVYKYVAGRDVMMYDFSLKEGDTFTYEVGFDQPVNCKVLKQGWLEDGPQIQMLDSLTADGAWTFKYRKLRTWTIGIDNGSGDYYEFITWIEYIGALRNMFSLPETDGGMSCLAYIERSDEYDYLYLPFSLYNMYGPIYGCNMPKMAADKSEEWVSQYTYELEGNRLHVFGKDVLNCGGNYYAYFTEEPTDDPLVHKLHFSIKEVGPQTTCSSLFTTDFYVSGFDPNLNYIVVDNYGEEHPVINKTPQMAYRPLVEEGKVWTYSYNNGRRQYMKSLTVSGDTIIGNQTYKKIVDVASQAVEMALREEGKKVYCCYPNQNTEYLLYDFGKNAGEVISKEIIYGDTRIRKVISVNTIMVKNNAFRCMTVHEYTIPEGMSEEEYFAGNYGYDSGFWVEGIGSFKYLDTPIPYDGDYYTFQECRIGDVTFKQKDFVAMPQNDYRPFVEDGKVWKVGNTQTISDNVVNVVDYYYFDGDTIIDGKTCKQMMCQRFVNPDYTNEYSTPKPSLTKVGAWYEEDKKVYYYDERKQSMVIKYDFSLGANDTLRFITNGSSPFIIGPKQTGGIEGFKGVYRDIRMCGDEGQSYLDTFWLEGVGCVRGPLSSPCDPILADPTPEFLMSCTVGDEVIYLNDEYEDGATPKDMEARKNRFDFTHTIKTKPKEPSKRREELSLYGEYDDSRLGINLNPLNDAYLVRITNESGEVVYEKTVNASAIVGLDIDISAYAKGCYTVTVENSVEAFTGLFETQTSGIEAISYQPAVVKHHIYNLHGQRLSSLQKGLNIVNGQKFFVK